MLNWAYSAIASPRADERDRKAQELFDSKSHQSLVRDDVAFAPSRDPQRDMIEAAERLRTNQKIDDPQGNR